MNNQIEKIQDKLINALDNLSNVKGEELQIEVARSNAISQLANTYIKSCNLIIRVQETKQGIKSKIGMMNDEK